VRFANASCEACVAWWMDAEDPSCAELESRARRLCGVSLDPGP
jgi:hypothetical protein